MFPPLFLVVECLSNKSIKTIQMIACEACHHEIASTSKTCPHCGHPNPLCKKTKILFYEWFVGILIAIFIPLSIIFPPTLTNNGIPNCDTAFTKNLAMQTLNNIPMIHILGITTIDLKDIQETEYTCN